MGKRAKRPSRETALRMRVGNLPAPLRTSLPEQGSDGKIRMRRTNAANEWAIKVFFPREGRMPTQDELCAALDSGTIGRWVEEVSKPEVIERVIVIGDTKIPYREWKQKQEKPKDYRYRDEMREMEKVSRQKRWRTEAENEAIQAAVAGTVKATAGQLEALAQKLYAKKKHDWEIDQLFSQ